MKDDSDGDKKQQINHIQNLYGFNLFCQKRFDDSMQVFAKLGTGMASPERPPPVVDSGSLCYGLVWFFSLTSFYGVDCLAWISCVCVLNMWAEP